MVRRNFRIMLAEHSHGRIVLAIPEVVLRELPKRYREQLESARTKVESALEALRILDLPPGGLEMPATAQAEASYLPTLRERLAELDVLMPALPTVALDDLFENAIVERRPFQDRGRGFKDALIWASVRELAQDDEVVFITRNYKDFAESEKRPLRLHPDLVADLTGDGHSPDRVRLVEDIDTFIQDYVPSSAIYLQTARDRFVEGGAWAVELSDAIHDALVTLDLGASDRVTLVSSDNASVEFNYVEAAEIDRLEIIDGYDIGLEDVVSLEVQAHARMRFNFTADRIDAEWLAAERADVDIDLVEETFAQGSTYDRPVVATFAVDFNVDTDGLGEPEKVSVTDDDGGDG